MAKFFTLIFALFAIPRYKNFFSTPIQELNSLAKRVLRMSAFLTGAIGTAWGSICLFAHLLPRTVLPQARWFWGGFLAGLFAILERKGGRGNFLYSVRLSIDSFWKVGKRRGWWKGFTGGDVWLFVLGLGVLNTIYEKDREAVRGGGVRMGVGWLRGEELFARRDEDKDEQMKAK